MRGGFFRRINPGAESAAKNLAAGDGSGSQLKSPKLARCLGEAIARASRRIRRSMFSIARLHPTERTSLNVYGADIPNVYDKNFVWVARIARGG